MLMCVVVVPLQMLMCSTMARGEGKGTQLSGSLEPSVHGGTCPLRIASMLSIQQATTARENSTRSVTVSVPLCFSVDLLTDQTRTEQNRNSGISLQNDHGGCVFHGGRHPPLGHVQCLSWRSCCSTACALISCIADSSNTDVDTWMGEQTSSAGGSKIFVSPRREINHHSAQFHSKYIP